MNDYTHYEFESLCEADIMAVLANGVHDVNGKLQIRYEVAAPTWMTNHCGMLNPKAPIRIRAVQGHNCAMQVKRTRLPAAAEYGPKQKWI